jgi:ribosome biogenesis protein ENP2
MRAGLTLLKDNRFSDMFKNPDFQINKESEEYKLLNPVVSKLDKAKKKKQQKLEDQFNEVEVNNRKFFNSPELAQVSF